MLDTKNNQQSRKYLMKLGKYNISSKAISHGNNMKS